MVLAKQLYEIALDNNAGARVSMGSVTRS